MESQKEKELEALRERVFGSEERCYSVEDVHRLQELEEKSNLD